MKKITKAIFPVAGYGTRFLPVTKACPKEMLPVFNKPLIQYAVEEAIAAGITQLIFVVNHAKRSVEDHFDRNEPLENLLKTKGKLKELESIQSIIPEDINCIFIRQPSMRGLGNAVYMARDLIAADEQFAILLPDEFLFDSPHVSLCLKQMIQYSLSVGLNTIATQAVAAKDIDKYGIVVKNKENKLLDLIEKPQVGSVESTEAVIGRYIVDKNIFKYIENMSEKVKINEEVQLTDALRGYLDTQSLGGYCYSGRRYDCGEQVGYFNANLAVYLSKIKDPAMLLKEIERHLKLSELEVSNNAI